MQRRATHLTHLLSQSPVKPIPHNSLCPQPVSFGLMLGLEPGDFGNRCVATLDGPAFDLLADRFGG